MSLEVNVGFLESWLLVNTRGSGTSPARVLHDCHTWAGVRVSAKDPGQVSDVTLENQAKSLHYHVHIYSVNCIKRGK